MVQHVQLTSRTFRQWTASTNWWIVTSTGPLLD